MRISTRRLCRLSIRLLIVATLAASAANSASAADVELIQAVKNGNATAVHALLDRGADVDARQGDGATALHWAAHLNDLQAADLLIRAGAAVDAANDLGVTPLWVATTGGSAAMVSKLLEARAEPDIAPDTGGTPLMIAARQGNVAAVRALLAHGADMNATEGAQGQTALMWAVARRHPQVVRVLLEVGADPHARTKSSRRHVPVVLPEESRQDRGDHLDRAGRLHAVAVRRAARGRGLGRSPAGRRRASRRHGRNRHHPAGRRGPARLQRGRRGAAEEGSGPGRRRRGAGRSALGRVARRPRAGGDPPGPRRRSGCAAHAGLVPQARPGCVRFRQVPGRRDAVRAGRPAVRYRDHASARGRRRRHVAAAGGWPDGDDGRGGREEHGASSTPDRGMADPGNGPVGPRSRCGRERRESVGRHRLARSGGQQVRQRHSAPRRARRAGECAQPDGTDTAGGCARAARGTRRIGHRRGRPRDAIERSTPPGRPARDKRPRRT